VVPLKTRQVSPLELQTPLIASLAPLVRDSEAIIRAVDAASSAPQAKI
jgi:hypothetical protein